MKHSIKDQISAVSKARKICQKENLAVMDKLAEQLNDAASTLAALNLIGQEVMLIAPELVSTVEKMLIDWHDGFQLETGVTGVFGLGKMENHLNKLENVLNRLPK